ncbi:MAG: TIGR02117 family protein [Methylobacterium mesophilicum]|nr:TIGR02117 family protein [Methylobacterium mesophilicum]
MVLLLCAVLLGAVVPRPLWSGETREPPSRRLLVLANPIHSDIAFAPDPDILSAFGFLAEDGLPLTHPNVGWIAFGWGGRSFYTQTPQWSDLKPGPLLRGLSYDASVMHVTLIGPVEPDEPGVLALNLSEAEFQRVVAAVRRSFRDDASGRPDLIEGVRYGPADLFYEAHGGFTALMGCNTWSSAVLREGGFRTGRWNPLPQSLMFSLRLFNETGAGTPQAAR